MMRRDPEKHHRHSKRLQAWDYRLGTHHRTPQRRAEIEGQPVSSADAARDWYREIYLPIVSEIECQLSGDAAWHRFPGKTIGDLYMLLAEHRWLRSERQGGNVGPHRAMPDLRLATEGRSWLRGTVEAVVPCRLGRDYPLTDGAADADAES